MNKSKFDPYEVLSVKRDASPEDIKAAARDHARNHHPDKGGEADEFAAGRRALAILSDPAKRQKFDTTGEAEDDKPNIIESQARGFIDQAIGEAVASYLQDNENPMRDPRRVDLVWVIKAALQTQIAEDKSQLKKIERQTVFFKDFVRRWKKKKKGGFDFLTRRFDDEFAKVAEGKVVLQRNIAAREMAIKMIDEYKFEHDPPVVPVATTASSYSTLGTQNFFRTT